MLLLLFHLFLALQPAIGQFFNITDSVWEDEYTGGKWDYIANVAIERARNSLISTFIETYGGVDSIAKKQNSRRKSGDKDMDTNGSTLKILDVGCGEGRSHA